MRFSLAPALISALLAGCSPASVNLFGDNQQSDSRQSAAVPTIVIAATGPGNCSARWDGSPVNEQQVTERSAALIEWAVAAAGGPQNMNENSFPIPNVEAPADLSMACADMMLFAMQRSGMIGVRLRPAAGQASVLADFPVEMNLPPPPIPMVLGIGAGGRTTWNNEPIDATALAGRLGYHGSTTAPEAGEEPPPGGIELRVTREAAFGQLYELLRTTRRYHRRPFVYLPSAEAGSPAAPPSPVVPPPPITPSGPPPVVRR
jgi:hypothetical protein